PHRLASTCPPQVDDASGVAHVHRSLFGSLPTQSSAAWGVSRVSHIAQPSRPRRSLCSACTVVGPCSRVPALARTRLCPCSFFHTGARALFRSRSSPGPRRSPQRLRFGGVRPPSRSAHSSLARPCHSFAPPVSAPHARSRLDLALAPGPFRAPPPRLHLSATRQLVQRRPRSSARPSALFAGLASPLAIACAATNTGKPSFDIATTALTALCPPARAGHLYLAIQAAVSRVSHPVHAPQPHRSPFASPPLPSRISALARTLVCLHPESIIAHSYALFVHPARPWCTTALPLRYVSAVLFSTPADSCMPLAARLPMLVLIPTHSTTCLLLLLAMFAYTYACSRTPGRLMSLDG
ncbi:hypothetical protein FRC08_009297, partial [Ceratobasidium sp. 394]